MIQRYTVSTFIAWWIGASVGGLAVSVVMNPNAWSYAQTIVCVYTAVLYVVYVLLTPIGERALNRVKDRFTSS